MILGLFYLFAIGAAAKRATHVERRQKFWIGASVFFAAVIATWIINTILKAVLPFDGATILWLPYAMPFFLLAPVFFISEVIYRAVKVKLEE